VFFTLKDPADGACLGVSMPRGQFDGLRLELADGNRVHVFGRPELYEIRGDFRLRALSIERFGLGDHLAALERLKRKLADEGLFAPERKRRLPLLPERIGLVTGNDAAAKRDVLATIAARFPPAHVVVAERYVQGPRAAAEIVAAIEELCAAAHVDVIVLARGGGSFEDLLPFSDERLVRAVAACRSSQPSATSRTRRSATSPPTSAPRRPPRPASSSFQIFRSSSSASVARGSASRTRPGGRWSARSSASTARTSACAARRR
jgi:exodeoxyribonuclease VII large subunit